MKATHIPALLAALLLCTTLVLKVFSHETKPHKPGTCVVSGEELGSMGKYVEVIHDHIEVLLCCKSFLKDFNKDPSKYMAMIKPATKH